MHDFPSRYMAFHKFFVSFARFYQNFIKKSIVKQYQLLLFRAVSVNRRLKGYQYRQNRR